MILHDPTTYPMFSIHDENVSMSLLVMARVEWHPPDFQNSVDSPRRHALRADRLIFSASAKVTTASTTIARTPSPTSIKTVELQMPLRMIPYFLSEIAHDKKRNHVADQRSPNVRPESHLRHAEKCVEERRHPKNQTQHDDRHERATSEGFVVFLESLGNSARNPIARDVASERKSDDAGRHRSDHRERVGEWPRPDQRGGKKRKWFRECRTVGISGVGDDERDVTPQRRARPGRSPIREGSRRLIEDAELTSARTRTMTTASDHGDLSACVLRCCSSRAVRATPSNSPSTSRCAHEAEERQ